MELNPDLHDQSLTSDVQAHEAAGNCRISPACSLNTHGCSAGRRPLSSRSTFALNYLHSSTWVLLGNSCLKASLSQPQGTFLSCMLCLSDQNVSSHQAAEAAEVTFKFSSPFEMSILAVSVRPQPRGHCACCYF